MLESVKIEVTQEIAKRYLRPISTFEFKILRKKKPSGTSNISIQKREQSTDNSKRNFSVITLKGDGLQGDKGFPTPKRPRRNFCREDAKSSKIT